MINYAEKYASAVDERFRLASKSAAFVNQDYDFEGVQTVKVYSIPTAPMNDYQLSGTNRYGVPQELGNSVQEMTLTQDRSFTFTIDRRSNTDAMGTMAAGTALARQLDEVVIPEVDTYRFAKMALGAGHVEMGEIESDKAYEAFLDANSTMTNALVPLQGRAAVVTPAFYKKIKMDANFIQAGDMAQTMRQNGQLGEVDGVAIFLAPAQYLPAGADFLIGQPLAVCAPQKLADYKVHDNPPGTNGWLVEGRIFHDAFVLANKKDALYYHIGTLGELTVESEAAEAGTSTITVTNADAILRAGGQLVYKAGASQTAPTLGLDVSSWTAFKSGDALTLTSGHKIAVALSMDGKAAMGGLATVVSGE